MKTYIQLDANGVAVGITETEGEIDHPSCMEVAPDAAQHLGKKWDGAQFIAVARPRKDEINEELARIDQKAGMPRLLRETLIAIGGAAVPGILKTHESNAASLRAELAAIK